MAYKMDEEQMAQGRRLYQMGDPKALDRKLSEKARIKKENSLWERTKRWVKAR